MGMVTANIAIGADGSTTIKASSSGLSFLADRTRFHALRSESDVIIIGGTTARNEPYGSTPIPLIVLSKSPLSPPVSDNPLAEHWHMNILEALTRARTQYSRILLEGGPALLTPALAAGQIDRLYLTISDASGGENRVDYIPLVAGYTEIERTVNPGGTFLTYDLAPSHQ